LTLRFSIDDKYETGDFDSRIGNDIELTTFAGGEAVSSIIIPYEQIHNGECTIARPKGIVGEVQLVAWGINADYQDTKSIYTPVPLGTKLSSVSLTSSIHNSEPHGKHTHAHSPLMRISDAFLGNVATVVDMPLHPTVCRIEVKMYTSQKRSGLTATIEGVTDKCDLQGNGIGDDDTYNAKMLEKDDTKNLYATGIVPVYPSRADQQVAVTISQNGGNIVRLTGIGGVPITASAAEYIVFEYDEDNLSLTIKVDDWTIEGEASIM
jgi:hypothetical protein